MKNHWARELIGHPWTPEENCWWLVRTVFRTQYGIEMPPLVVGDFADGENVAAIKKAASVSGWRRCDEGTVAMEGDILLMNGPIGERHVGVMIAMSRGLRFLHSEGFMTQDGPTGSVTAPLLRDVLSTGYTNVEIWRKHV